MPVLDFWFDFASTYSYLSAMRIAPLASDAGVSIRWKPFLLGPIFAGQGWDTSPFNIYPAKGDYMWRDVARLADLYGVPIKRPETFPQFTLNAARVGVAASDQPWLADFCRALFAAEYGQGGDITSNEAIAAALHAAKAEPDEWMKRAQDPDTKQALKTRVEQAKSLGIFGAPAFVAPDRELFWGDDRLDQAIAWTLKT